MKEKKGRGFHAGAPLCSHLLRIALRARVGDRLADDRAEDALHFPCLLEQACAHLFGPFLEVSLEESQPVRALARLAAAVAHVAQELFAAAGFVCVDVRRAEQTGRANQVAAVTQRRQRSRRLANERARIPRKSRCPPAQICILVCLRGGAGG